MRALEPLGLSPANMNGGGQVVVAGELHALSALQANPPAGARVIPLQVDGNINGMIAAVNIRPVPSGQYLSAEQVKASMPDHEPVLIDGRVNGNVIEFDPQATEEDVA